MDKYLSISTDSQFYSPCFTAISNEIKIAIVTISDEFKSKLSEDSFKKINHLFSNLDALATVGIFDHLYSIENDRLRGNVALLKEKIFSKLKEIGDQAYNKRATLAEIKRSIIKLQMAKHILVDNEFQDVVLQAMERAIVAQNKRHGILTLSQLFTDPNTTKTTRSEEKGDVKTDADDSSGDNNHDDYWCNEIINSFPMFSGAVIHSFNAKHGKNAKDIDSAIEKMLVGKSGNDSIDDNEKKMSKILYESFDNKYWQLINKYIIKSDVKNAMDIVKKKTFEKIRRKIASVLMNNFQDYKRCDMIIELMAYIFCVWTLLDCKHFIAMKKQHDEHIHRSLNDKDKNHTVVFDMEVCKSYLRQPKATQILAIMRLLGINEQMESNLIEIKTGEGKSLVLAVSACVIALTGYNAFCTCYGELLTQRDYREFESLFVQLQVTNKIVYGTYSDICSSLIGSVVDASSVPELIGKTSKYTEYTVTLENKQNVKANPKNSDTHWNVKNTVLLVDEVDVLFDQRYFGKNYWQYTKLRHRCISQMIDTVWDLHCSERLCDPSVSKIPNVRERIEKIMQMIRCLKSYNDCEEIFGLWMPLIDKEIEAMIIHVQLLRSHPYIVRDDRICYYKEDSITHEYRYGYKTMFAYYKEFQQKKISKKRLENEKCIQLTHGCISYAELPCKFMCIAGVTGTLSQLEIGRKECLQNKYNINKYTYIPTMFKENELKFDKDTNVTTVLNGIEWKKRVHDEIVAKMGIAQQRPVLVFFQTSYSLQFYHGYYTERESIGDDKLNCKCLALNEELEITEKTKVIKDACRLNTITLCTRIFGRGTDFIVTDDRVNNLGGPHVIQTFFSWDISEEIQIKGRTARNGGNGSFSMVLNKASTPKMIRRMSYNELDKKRKQVQQESNENMLKSLAQSKEHHDNTARLREYIDKENSEEVLKLLMEFQLQTSNLKNKWKTSGKRKKKKRRFIARGTPKHCSRLKATPVCDSGSNRITLQ